MNILLLGSGGREHALAWKISQSPECTQLYIAPGNPGTQACGTNIKLSPVDFNAIGAFVLEKNIQLVVVGPEDPLVKGIADYFQADVRLRKVPVIGPAMAGARLEGSKDFSKGFMQRQGIPTAAYRSFTAANQGEALPFMRTLTPPYVLKADGLAAGKGVLILDDIHQADRELKAMFSGKFGAAGDTVVIEQFLKGIELSVFILTDGRDYVILPEAKDYKRIGEGDTGLNTGGMGSVSGVPFANKSFMETVERTIVQPTVEGLQRERIPYVGFIFFGLINVAGQPFVIEYNARMGDPETESVIPRLKSDLVELFEVCAHGGLSRCRIETDPRHAATVMMVSGGYPGLYEKGKPIRGLDQVTESLVFHAGTGLSADGRALLANGGRVLAVTSLGESMEMALTTSYRSLQRISFENAYFRKDIGYDLQKR